MSLEQILYASPRQNLSIIFQVLNSQDIRVDAPTTPVVNKIYSPNLSILDGYPAPMTRLDTGLYSFTFTLPTGASNLGSFIIDIVWTNPENMMLNKTFYQVISRMNLNSSGGYYAIE